LDKADAFNKMIQEAGSTKLRLFFSAVYLFSTKGYNSVGIRELTRSVNIRESAFYNHFKNKEDLFTEILNQFIELSNTPVLTNQNIEEIIQSGNIDHFLKANMQAYISMTNDPLYFTLLQIILMESYTNSYARELYKLTDYFLQMEKILEQMMIFGQIKNIDIHAVTISYFYGLKGIMQEFILMKAWNENTDEMIQMINDHVNLFARMIRIEER
jgi:AcrR family transcriptional regulator